MKKEITEEKIRSIKANLFYRSIDSIKDYAAFDWHRDRKKEIDTDCVNSSQGLAIDFWGCIAASRYKNEIINMLFKKDETNWDIIFEYEDKSLLNEKKSTQIDVLLSSSRVAIFVEGKFTERDGGFCSQTIKTKDGLTQCWGRYETYRNPVNGIENKCSLSGKGIKYWKYIDILTEFKENKTYDPCPIKNGEYQWIRNICFAKAYSEKHIVSVENILVYLDSNKCSISEKVRENSYLGNLKGKLINGDAFRPVSYNSLLQEIINYFDKLDQREKSVFIDLEYWIDRKVAALN